VTRWTRRLAPGLLTATLGCGARSALPVGESPSTHIYVADSGNDRIVRMDDLTGDGWTTEGGIAGPCGVTLDAQERIYVAGTMTLPLTVLRIDDISGAGGVSLDGSPSSSGSQGFGLPNGVAVDGSGHIYVVDAVFNRVVRVDDMDGNNWIPLGGVNAASGTGAFSQPSGIAVSAEGRILVGDLGNHRIVQADDISGAGWQELAIPGNPAASPYGVSFDASGRIYAVDSQSSVLHRFDSIAGDGAVAFSSPALAQLSHVFVHEGGRIFMTMGGGSGVAAMDDMSGAGLTVLGTPGSGVDQFTRPCGIAVR